jgi:hypothetical protein
VAPPTAAIASAKAESRIEMKRSHDVFISYSRKNKKMVLAIAERFRADKLSVWIDSWSLEPGEAFHPKIMEGLEQSQVILVCVSKHSTQSDWVQYETFTKMAGDPLNKAGRAIFLQLDRAPPPGHLKNFQLLWWYEPHRDATYSRLLHTIKRRLVNVDSGADPHAAAASRQSSHGRPRAHVEALSPNGKWTAFANDQNLQLLEVARRARPKILEGHTRRIDAIAWAPGGRHVASGARDFTIRVWNIQSKQPRCLSGHDDRILSLAFGVDWKRLLSASADQTLRLWTVANGRWRVVLRHTSSVTCIAWHVNQRFALTGADDGTVTLVDLEKAIPIFVDRGSGSSIQSVNWNIKGTGAYSRSGVQIRPWDFAKLVKA